MAWSWRLVNIAIVLALVVVLLGGWTRLNDAGLGCPDWPTCYGHFVLPGHDRAVEQIGLSYPGHHVDLGKGWIEMVHRYGASILGLVILILAFRGWALRKVAGYPATLSLGLLVLVLLQGAFGMWTVTFKLVPWVVTLHLLGGLTMLALLVRLRQRLAGLRSGAPFCGSGVAAPCVALLVGALFFQMALGGWTSSNYAGWACDHWVTCHGVEQTEYDFREGFNLSLPLGPNYEGGLLPAPARAAIQMSHRAGALLFLAVLILVSWRMREWPEVRLWLIGCWAAASLQILLGIMNVIWQLPLGLAVAHHACAVVLLLSVMGLYGRSHVQRSEVIHGNLSTGQVQA